MVTVEWIGHSSFRITDGESVIYIDPWKLKLADRDADLVLVGHSHHDHYSASDIAKVSNDGTVIVGPGDVIKAQGQGNAVKPKDMIEIAGIKIEAVAAYNPAKQFHPKGNNWCGYVIGIGGKRIYFAGDTDCTEEMKALRGIDLALLPVGGTYTMDGQQAAEAVGYFKPSKAVPYHWGDIVGTKEDAERFKKKASCQVVILENGESITI